MVEHSGRVRQSRIERRKRSRWARVAIMVALLILTYGLLELQLFSSEMYVLQARGNRLKPVTVRAPRGTIYDTNGRVVAENTVGYEILLMPAPVDTLRATLERLRPVLGLTEAEMEEAIDEWRQAPSRPLTVENDASPTQIARLQERRYRFGGVLINEYPKRHYPYGPAVAHVTGYVGEIDEDELELERFEEYRPGRIIGKAGIEASYEEVLGGVPGVRYMKVDARGNIEEWVSGEVAVPPIPGRDLQLHLDLDLQRYVQEVLFPQFAIRHDIPMEEMEAAFVAIDPQTGGVLSLVSVPSYDPNVFIGGIEPEAWQELISDPQEPLLNRAAGDVQPPGSIWKLLTAAMALELGVIEPEEQMPIPCTGGMSYAGRYSRCWGVHGYQDLVSGIKNSCDVYFYQVGIRIGLERFMEMGVELGFGEQTGIDLPAEIAPIYPEGPEWWKAHFGYPPQPSEIMSLAIGQGAITMHTLKMVNMYVAFARDDGKAFVPEIVDDGEPPEVSFRLPDLSEREIWYLRNGMRHVTGPDGTAFLTRLQDWDLMGKTGTAQNPRGKAHGWFVGIAGPRGGEPPEIVAGAIVYHGVHSYYTSNVVGNAIAFYLNRQHGREFERHPVPRVRLDLGLPVDWPWLISPVEIPPPPEVQEEAAVVAAAE